MQRAVASVRNRAGDQLGWLMVLSFSDPGNDQTAEALVQRLAARLSHWIELLEAVDRHPKTEDGHAADQLEARLRGAMRAMQMGSWVYSVAPRRLALSADAAMILGLTAQQPRNLDELVQSFTIETAKGLRRAFVACIRDGKPIDEEVQCLPAGEPRRWMRFIGEAAIGAHGGAVLM